MLDAEQIVEILLDEAVIDPDRVKNELLMTTREIASKTNNFSTFLKMVNQHPLFQRYKVWLVDKSDKDWAYWNTPAYRPRGRWIMIPVDPSVDAAVKEIAWHLGHELVHKGQHSRMGYKLSPYHKSTPAEQQQRAKSGGAASLHAHDIQRYFDDPHEIMAYAYQYVQDLVQRGFTREQVLDKLRQQETNTGPPYVRSHYNDRASPDAVKRFLKYAYEYAQRLKA